ncbi:AGAP006440-PA-like protein [Anopheles sinensis]|uniref:AGAP006440-PA-like protein n=1 Tax=Anopheles sinensis TaxID=74873 RepID=A0A084WP62_ANOSI|nr:AGAP006440-PA-like protein [Anopheles sinensis]
MDPLQVNNRSHSPSQFLVISFLVRVITELHCNSCTTETVGLVNFNTPGLEYIPSQLMLQLPEVTFISVDLNRKFVKQKDNFYVPIILHGISAETELEVEKLVQLFALYGKERK